MKKREKKKKNNSNNNKTSDHSAASSDKKGNEARVDYMQDFTQLQSGWVSLQGWSFFCFVLLHHEEQKSLSDLPPLWQPTQAEGDRVENKSAVKKSFCSLQTHQVHNAL